MKKKSNKKFVPSVAKPADPGKVKPEITKKTPATVNNPKKKSAAASRQKSVARPWYARPVAMALFALVAVAVIAAVAGYFAGQQANIPAPGGQASQNGTQPAQPQASSSGLFHVVVSNAEVTDTTASSITVKWKTDVACLGEAHAIYTNRDLTISSFPEDKPTTQHSALIAALAPATEYKIEIVSKDSKGNKEVFILDGIYRTVTPRTAMAIGPGDSAPAFSLADTTGKNHSLADYKGKWVILVFWDLTCNSCKEEMPYINAYFKSMPDNMALLAVSYKGQASLIESYLKNQKLGFPGLLDTDGAVSDKFTIASYPTTILIDGNGKIARIKQAAFKNSKEITDFVQEGMNGK
jgi:peroxiredoxin